MQILTFCSMFFKTETNETLDSSIKTMFIKVKKGTKHPEAYSWYWCSVLSLLTPWIFKNGKSHLLEGPTVKWLRYCWHGVTSTHQSINQSIKNSIYQSSNQSTIWGSTPLKDRKLELLITRLCLRLSQSMILFK